MVTSTHLKCGHDGRRVLEAEAREGAPVDALDEEAGAHGVHDAPEAATLDPAAAAAELRGGRAREGAREPLAHLRGHRLRLHFVHLVLVLFGDRGASVRADEVRVRQLKSRALLPTRNTNGHRYWWADSSVRKRRRAAH